MWIDDGVLPRTWGEWAGGTGWEPAWAGRVPGPHGVGVSGQSAGPLGCWTGPRAVSTQGQQAPPRDPSALTPDSYPSGTGPAAGASPGARCASGRPSHPHRGCRTVTAASPTGRSAPGRHCAPVLAFRRVLCACSAPLWPLTCTRPEPPSPSPRLPIHPGPALASTLPGSRLLTPCLSASGRLHAPGCPGPFPSEPN